MTARSSIDPAEFLHEHLAQASPDLLRQLMEGFINTLLSADGGPCGPGIPAMPCGPPVQVELRATIRMISPKPSVTMAR